MQFINSIVLALSLALSATAVTNPSIARDISERTAENSTLEARAFLSGTQTGQGQLFGPSSTLTC